MPDNPPTPDLTVLYDGQCPLCRREIALYRGLPSKVTVCCADISDPALDPPSGRTREELLARFHVRQADGQLLSGAAAFVALWRVMPGWRWLAKLSQLPGAAWLMEAAYRVFLTLRPTLQSGARLLEGTPRAVVPPSHSKTKEP